MIRSLTLSLLTVIAAVLCIAIIEAPLLNLQIPLSFSIFLHFLGHLSSDTYAYTP